MNTMEDTFKMPWLLKHNSRELPEEVFSLHQEINDSRIYWKFIPKKSWEIWFELDWSC